MNNGGQKDKVSSSFFSSSVPSVTPMEGELEGAAVLATQGDQAMKHLSLRRLERKGRETRVT